ncbi:MAG: 16S rRNA (guanine(966)-N(2))-methyltransferase RsmD [Candidatus Loosdrechtia sp.]|uniref:RsmD family RNA methyltransferase n=1 Tax=Candidatus Loosdrechtia sp. TaxID=3101272 RepID=UPI003A6830A8|nr:MAG: 16S rRNA (guanine(966)-N(2))-methyltransferase RsmD [Candidatus Jettenia sp. AMX2]
MRVIGGSAKGILLSAVKGEDTRPILDRVKESLFNILTDVIPGSDVIDLFAGTGAIGIEALSRGAKSCIFVERDKTAIQVIKKNLAVTRLQDKARVLPYDVFKVADYLEKNKIKSDLVFASPPYPLVEQNSYMNKLLALFSLLNSKQILEQGGLIVLQHRTKKLELSFESFYLDLFDARVYGETQLSFFRNVYTQQGR